jgi:NAD(P)-dependent dehydrogenase (short-subunit alcohol dehydrogenase family)
MGVLSSRVAPITGGAKGIGWGITCLFCRERARVVMMGRNVDTLGAAEKLIRQQGEGGHMCGRTK